MIDESVDARPRIGISSCLLGEEVRYDGGHELNAYLTETLGRWFEYTPFCPEVAIGLGVPRPPIRLVATDSVRDSVVRESVVRESVVRESVVRDPVVRAERVDGDGGDATRALDDYGKEVARLLGGYSGYILKKDSPSCGMARVRVYRGKGKPPARSGTGIFATSLMAALPNLPVEEEGRLMDSHLRGNFIGRVFTYHRWQRMLAAGPSAAALGDFHRRHEFLVLAHDEPAYRALGRIVARAGAGDLHETAAEYVAKLMAALRKRATPRKHANVLMHIAGFFKKYLAADDKAELLELIDRQRRGLVPVIVPITLINHFRRKYSNDYIDDQFYLEPYPAELMLRNET